MSFQNLGLSPVLLRALETQGYTAATPIQAEAIPLVLQGRDVMACAPTGTGKTAAFALPLLERLFPQGQSHGKPGKRPRALVLTPTRELAAQVHASARDCGKGLPLRSTTIFGGVSMRNQLKALQQGLDLLVATPGRLIDHLEHGSVDLGGVEILVLDEADRMLDMGFLPALRKLIARLPRQRQTLLFSATFAGPIKALATQLLRDPAQVQVTPPNTVTATVSHRMHPVDADRKRDLLLHILAEDSRRQTLVFGRTKHGADKLVRFLEQSGLRAAAIHGNKSQNQRTRALQGFKDHRITVLVATDIAARGLDIEQLPLVINHDLPMVAEDYVHRIGRTGRAGANGLAISLVSHEETGLLRDIQKILKDPIEIRPMAGYEPSQPLRLDSNARPQQKPRSGNRNGNAAGKHAKRRPHAQQGQRRQAGGHAQAPKRGNGNGGGGRSRRNARRS
ncbi:MAG TPA: DEAD/DEAH box helicase [Rhodanobacteraceae bacterium]|nr:DEAD/DEAH box helicase [Rhodanobacteraceae bacterium]